MTPANVPNTPALSALFEEASALLQRGNVAAAAQRFQAILRRDACHVPSLQLLGILEARKGKLGEGVDLLKRAVQLAPNSAEAHNNLGIVLHAIGQSAQAAKHYEKSIALNPRYAIAHNNLGIALAALNRQEEAVVQYRCALALQPDYPEALNNLSNALSRLDRRTEAVEQLQRALTIRPEFVEARMNLGIVLSQLDRHDEAIVQYRRALAVQHNAAPLHFNLGNALYSLNRHEEAIAHYQEALTREPGMALAASNLGLALKELGRLEEARLAYEKAIAIEPRRPAHYHGVIGTRKITRGDPHLAAMEVLAGDMAAFPLADQIDLHFALGAALAEVGENKRSFEHYRQGNALRRGELRYDERKVLGRLENVRNIFTRELTQQKRGKGDPSPLPIFIIGMPRSGSTLVEQILASHPAVHAAGEINDFREAVRMIDAQTGDKRFPDNVPDLSEGQLRALAETYLTRISNIASRSSSKAQRVTDKLPANFRYAGLIHLALPNARIIHTFRDPIDTCLSCFSTHFVSQPFTYDLSELGRYYRAYARLMAHWRTVLPRDALLEVQYEELVTDFPSQARRIVAHCGLEWNDACLAFHQTRRPVKTASLAQVRQAIYQSSIGRWRPDDTALAPLLIELGLTQDAAIRP